MHRKILEEKVKTEETPLKETSLFESLKTENYQTKPPKVWVSENGLFKTKPVQEIEEEHKFQWKEDIFITTMDPRITWSTVLGDPVVREFQYCLNHAEECNDQFALKHFNEDIGWGVVAKKELNQCNKLLSFYASKVVTQEDPPYDGYFYKMNVDVKDYAYHSTDALRFGNITRFMMHLPKKDDIIDLSEVPDVDPSKIARANCEIGYVEAKDTRIPAIIQTKPIKPNEVIGYSYGTAYWSWILRSFWLVEKDGTKIVKASYDRNFSPPRIRAWKP